jgi:transforming growth factor-beta-induced protein
MFKNTNKIITILMAILLVSVLTTSAFAAPASQADKTIVDIAVEDGRFTTLVTALQAADLVDTLSGEGPFTVFAPTDDAFAALPEGTLDSLLADIPALTDILLYHVVPGKVLAADVLTLDSANTVLGQPVAISVEGESVKVDNAQVIITDIEASNGVIHVIDAVIIPSDEAAMAGDMPKDIVDTAVADGRFTTLATALDVAGLIETLKGEGPFTVFAPTDDAFAALPEGTLDSLLADIPALTDVLLYHVVPGKVLASDVIQLSAADTVLGQPVSIEVDGDTVMVNEAQVIITDIEGSNGVIHVVDAVILPPQAEAPATLPVSGGETSSSTNYVLLISLLGLVLVISGAALRLSFSRSK